MGTRWKLILFDLDNTLYSNEHSFEEGIRYALEHLQYHQRVDINSFYMSFKKRSDELWKRFENQEITLTDYRRTRFQDTAREFGWECTDDEADHFHNTFSGKVMEYVEPFPRLRETLDYIIQHFAVGIITNGPFDHQHVKLERLQIHDLFGKHNVFNSGEIGIAKPDQRIFLHALQKLDFEPHETLFIGDSWEADVVGALDCGMDAIWLNTLKKKPTTNHQPLATLDSFEELLPFLQ